MAQSELSPISEVIEDARNGRMFILVDDEDRENEGDLVIPAEKASPEAMNFMAKYGRGLICLSLTPERAEELGLELMAAKNQSRHQTAFTVSIEAREGVTTGISAADRAETIAVAINPNRGAHRHRHAGPRVPADRAARRRAGARRPYRSRRRRRAPGRPQSVGRDLRDHERRRHHGAPAGPAEVRQDARPQGRLDRRPDRLSAAAPKRSSRKSPRPPSTAASAAGSSSTCSPTRWTTPSMWRLPSATSRAPSR